MENNKKLNTHVRWKLLQQKTEMRRELAINIVVFATITCILSIIPFLIAFVITWGDYDDNHEIYSNNYSPSVGGGRVSTTTPMTVQSYVKYSNDCGDQYQFITTYNVFEGYNESCIVNRDTCYDLQYLYQNHPIGKIMDISYDPNCNEACDTQYYTEQKANNAYPKMKSLWISKWVCLCGFIFSIVFGMILFTFGKDIVNYLTTPTTTTIMPRRRSREVVTTPNETIIQKNATLEPTAV